MLQAIMDQKLFLYGMIVAGIVGVWCLFWSNRFYHIAIKDMSRRKSPKGKWTSQVMELYNRRETPVKFSSLCPGSSAGRTDIENAGWVSYERS